jgi:hypothetical protein
MATDNVLWYAVAHAQTIRTMSMARQAYRQLTHSRQDILARPQELPSILAHVHARLGDMQVPVHGRRDSSLHAAMQDDTQTYQPGIPTGFTVFDDPRGMGGLKPGKILVLVGREKGRKSTIAQQVTLRLALDQVSGTYYTFDGRWLDIRDSLVVKLATANLLRWDAPVQDLTLKADELDPNALSDIQNQAVQEARTRLARVSQSLWIMDKQTGIGDLDVLEQEIRRGVRDRGDQYVVIDYIQDISWTKTRTERETLNAAVQRLDNLCRSLGVASIWVSQRSDENNRLASQDIVQNTMPATVGTKESKKPAEAADYLMLVHYDQINQPDIVRVGFWGGRHIGRTGWHALWLNPTSGLITNPREDPRWF